jgi:ABC-2 type transport system ATP-binding protein
MLEISAIEARHLTVEYKVGRKNCKKGVDDLSFRVGCGEIVGFIGPNGAGKTSAIKALLDFTPSVQGTCLIKGRPSNDREARALIGYMPEISYYPKYLTLREFLDSCAAISGVRGRVRSEAVAGAAERVGMASKLNTRLSNFSKGMLQQAGCAQALVHNPEILILDEPMSGLDPIARMRMRHLLSGLRDEGKTILFSSHELGEIEMVADRVLLMNAGRLVYEGTITEIVSEDGDLEKAYLRLLGEGLPWAA